MFFGLSLLDEFVSKCKVDISLDLSSLVKSREALNYGFIRLPLEN